MYRPTRGESVYRIRLVVQRAGKTVLAETIPSYRRESPATWPGALVGRQSVAARDLDGDGEPEIVVDLHWGGAHCCWWSRIYRWQRASRRYVAIIHLWGDVAYRLADLDRDRRIELVTSDTRFAYAFASFADSSFPLQIWMYRAGHLGNTTRAYPALVRRDAAKQWRWYRMARNKRRNVLGVLAAWTADQCLLGNERGAFARLRRLGGTGDLDDRGWGSRANYLRKLRVFLRQTGYLA